MRIVTLLLACLFTFTNNLFAQSEEDTLNDEGFTLNDFYSNDSSLVVAVDYYFNQLSPSDKVAQLIMPAIGKYGDSDEKINEWVKNKQIGGLLLLNGTKSQFTGWVNKYNQWNEESNSLPFLYSADAEPSLVNRKILNSTPVKHANKLQSEEEVIEVAETISKDLNDIGINYNFAPVVDMSPNTTVGWRSFGRVPEHIVPWSTVFIKTSQDNNIIATAKHFPGHGLVDGDSHKQLVYINGEMKEIGNYIPLIRDGVISIMIGHIAVENNPLFNTKGLPASISKNIITDLLRDSLNFKGLVVTDAMNMKGVSTIPDADVKAIEAGVDILLMPLNAGKAHAAILKKYLSDEDFKAIVDLACKRVIRAKLCTESQAFLKIEPQLDNSQGQSNPSQKTE